MGFYGKVTNSSKAQFSFDRIYSNRIAMEKNVNKDSVFVNRYVLIEYDQIPFTDRPVPDAMPLDYQTKAAYLLSVDNVPTLYKAGSTDASQATRFEPSGLNQIIWVPAEQNFVDVDENGKSKEKIFIITSFIDSNVYTFEEAKSNINYGINFKYDQEKYGPSRGYDSTVWQKVYNNGEYKYVMVAELNTVVPSFTVSQDAPTLSPITPHFDENSTNVLYNLHVQPQWGFRVKKAGITRNATIDSSTGAEIEGTESSTGSAYSISDETTGWTKSEYNKSTNQLEKYYYDKNDQWVKYYGETPPETNNIASNIYYFKDGFNSLYGSLEDNKTNSDYINLTPTGSSGHLYNNHNNRLETSNDIQELSIYLPSIGRAISEVWDLLYGNSATNLSSGNTLPNRYKLIILSKSEYNEIKKDFFKKRYYYYSDSYNSPMASDKDNLLPINWNDEYNPYRYYYKKINYYQRNKNIEWVDGSFDLDNTQLKGLRLIKKFDDEKTNTHGFDYSINEVETLAGAINTLHDLTGMIISSVKINDLSREYLDNSSDNRIYFLDVDDRIPDLNTVEIDDQTYKTKKYYRKHKRIEFIDIAIKNATKDGLPCLVWHQDNDLIEFKYDNNNGHSWLYLNGNLIKDFDWNKDTLKAKSSIVINNSIGSKYNDKYYTVLHNDGRIERYCEKDEILPVQQWTGKQIIKPNGTIELKAFTPKTLEEYKPSEFFIKDALSDDNQCPSLWDSPDTTAVEGKTYYMAKEGANYWLNRKLTIITNKDLKHTYNVNKTLLKWEVDTYWKQNNNIYEKDNSAVYSGGIKYAKNNNSIGFNQLYLPNPESNIYIRLLEVDNNQQPHWIQLCDNNGEIGGITVNVKIPYFDFQKYSEFRGNEYSLFSQWIDELYKSGIITAKLKRKYLDHRWKFDGYYRCKKAEGEQSNIGNEGLINSEKSYTITPYERILLDNPYYELQDKYESIWNDMIIDNSNSSLSNEYKFNLFKPTNYKAYNFITENRSSSLNDRPNLYIKTDYKIIPLITSLIEYCDSQIYDQINSFKETEEYSSCEFEYKRDKETKKLNVIITRKTSENAEKEVVPTPKPILVFLTLINYLEDENHFNNLLNKNALNIKEDLDTNKINYKINDNDILISWWNSLPSVLYAKMEKHNPDIASNLGPYYKEELSYIDFKNQDEYNNFINKIANTNYKLYKVEINDKPIYPNECYSNLLFYKNIINDSNNNETDTNKKSLTTYLIFNEADDFNKNIDYYSGTLIPINSSDEFNAKTIYYYSHYVFTKEQLNNDLDKNFLYTFDKLKYINTPILTDGDPNQEWIKWREANSTTFISELFDNYIITKFDNIPYKFYEPNKYYCSKNSNDPTEKLNYHISHVDIPDELAYSYYKVFNNEEDKKTWFNNDFKEISSDYIYKPDHYYTELAPNTGIYILATEDKKGNNITYYSGENYYIISDDSGLYSPGAVWNMEVPVPETVHLGIIDPHYEWVEMKGFGRTLNTANGLILKLNQLLEMDDALTRDTSTVKGCINQLNDIIGRFGAMRPADLLITDSRGRVIGSDYSSLQEDRITNYGKFNSIYNNSEERIKDINRNVEGYDYKAILGLNHIENNDYARDSRGRWISFEVKNYSLLNKYYTTEAEILSQLKDSKLKYSESNDNNLGTLQNIQDVNPIIVNNHTINFYYEVDDLLTDFDYNDYRNKFQYKNNSVLNSDYLGDLYFIDYQKSTNIVERVKVTSSYDRRNKYLLKINLTQNDWDNVHDNPNYKISLEELKHRLVSTNSIVEIKHEKYPYNEEQTNTASNKNKTFTDTWENVGNGNNQNGNKDTIELYAPIVDDMGHIVGRNTETVTLPYGYKHIKTDGQSTEAVKDLFTASYNNTDTSGASETKTPVANSGSNNSANNTQDILSINPGNKWIQLKADDNTNSLTIAHEVHTVNRLTDSTDLNASTDSYSNSKDKITVQDIEFDNAGHVVTNRKHTYTLPYSYKQFTTSQDTSDSSITQNTSTTTANNTQDKVTFKMGNKWLTSRVDNDIITFAHETHWTSENDNVSYPGNNNTNRTDVKTATASNLNGQEDFTVESYKFDNAGHVISHNTHTYELPHNYSFIDLIGTTGSTNFIDGTGSSGSPTVLAALEAKARFSMYAGNRWITIKGTDTNGDKVNDSITFSHAAAGTAINTKGDSSNRVLDYGSTFNTIRTGIDEAGHVSVLEQYSVKLPTQSISGTGNVVTSAVHSQNNLAFTHAQLMDLALSNSTTATTVATAPAFNGSTQNHTSILSTDTLKAALGKVPNMIQDSIRDIINASDTSLDTLKEIADWISQDPNNTALNNYKSLVELEKDIYGLNGNALKVYNSTISLQDRASSLETSKNNLYSMLGNVDSYNPNATYPDGTTKGTLENRVNWAETQINKYVTDDLKNKVDAAWNLLKTVQQTTGNIQNSTDGYMKYHVGPTAPTDADGNIITNAMWIDTTDPNNVLVKFPLISSVDSNGRPQGITWLAINTWQ